jgi:hypothetical protein
VVTVSETDWVEVFWELLRDSGASDDSPYLGDTMQRLLSRAIGRPECVAWIKVSGFNKIEAYIYDTTDEGDESPVLPLLNKVGYTKLRRPRDPSDIDWVVEFTPRG